MKNRKIVIFLFFVAILGITCKKEHLPTETNATGSPVFFCTATINGNPINYQSGINNYYAYSSYTQDSNNVYNFTGSVAPVSGTGNSIKFVINNYESSASGASAVIDSSLTTTNYSYLIPGGTPTKYQMHFDPFVTAYCKNITYNYTFGDGTSANTNSQGGDIVHIYNHPGAYSTYLSVNFNDSVSSGLGRVVKIGTPDAGTTTSLIYDNFHSPWVIFNRWNPSGTNPLTFLWNFGDGSTSSVDSVWHYYNVTNKFYKVSLTITDKNNYSSTDSANVYVGWGPYPYYLNWINISSKIVPNPMGMSNVSITYTDGSGNVYTSDNPSQPSNSSFQILSVSSYQNNANNQTVKMLHILFNCMVYNASGKSAIPITNGDAVIAVAYK